MPDQPSDAPAEATRAGLRAQRAGATDAAHAPAGGTATDPAPAEAADLDLDPLSSHDRLPDWRGGGPTVAAWREGLLGIALLSIGGAVVLGAAILALWPSPWAAASATVVLWIGMLLPVVIALSRSRPAGLMRFRALDLLYAVVLGGVLRLTQGWLETAFGGTGALPSYALVDGALPTGWWVTDGLGAAVVAPVLEEFFFRGVVLVALYTLLRRPFGAFTAGLVALLVSCGLFILLHGLTLTLSLDAVISLGLLSLVCGLLVLLTGRIWAAVLTHIVFNSTYIALAIVGTHWF